MASLICFYLPRVQREATMKTLSKSCIHVMNASEGFSQAHAGHQLVLRQRSYCSLSFMPIPGNLGLPYTLATAKTVCSWVELEAIKGRMDGWLQSPLVRVY